MSHYNLCGIKQAAYIDHSSANPPFELPAFLDDDLLAYSGADELPEEMIRRRYAVNFNQTFDIAHLNESSYALLRGIDYRNARFGKRMIHCQLELTIETSSRREPASIPERTESAGVGAASRSVRSPPWRLRAAKNAARPVYVSEHPTCRTRTSAFQIDAWKEVADFPEKQSRNPRKNSGAKCEVWIGSPKNDARPTITRSERGPDGSMPADSRPLQSLGPAAAADRHTLRRPPGCRRVCRPRALLPRGCLARRCLEPTASGGSSAKAIV